MVQLQERTIKPGAKYNVGKTCCHRGCVVTSCRDGNPVPLSSRRCAFGRATAAHPVHQHTHPADSHTAPHTDRRHRLCAAPCSSRGAGCAALSRPASRWMARAATHTCLSGITRGCRPSRQRTVGSCPGILRAPCRAALEATWPWLQACADSRASSGCAAARAMPLLHPAGRYILSWGRRGSGRGETLQAPRDLAGADDGSMMVLDK